MKSTTTTTAWSVALGVALGVAACDNPNKMPRDTPSANSPDPGNPGTIDREAERAKQVAESTVDREQLAMRTLTEAKNDTHAQMTSLLLDIDQRIAELRAASEGASADVKAKNERTIGTLMAKRDAIATDLKQIDQATMDTWDQVRHQVDKDAADARTTLAGGQGKT
jgi:hypothetical protein